MIWRTGFNNCCFQLIHKMANLFHVLMSLSGPREWISCDLICSDISEALHLLIHSEGNQNSWLWCRYLIWMYWFAPLCSLYTVSRGCRVHPGSCVPQDLCGPFYGHVALQLSSVGTLDELGLGRCLVPRHLSGHVAGKWFHNEAIQDLTCAYNNRSLFACFQILLVWVDLPDAAAPHYLLPVYKLRLPKRLSCESGAARPCSRIQRSTRPTEKFP